MSAPHREEISSILGSPPILLHAADFGWVHRPRFYWVARPEQYVGHQLPLAPSLEPFAPDTVAKSIFLARWSGGPPPATWRPGGGWSWDFRAEHGVQGLRAPGTAFAPTYPEGRLTPSTTAFPHPADRPPRKGPAIQTCSSGSSMMGGGARCTPISAETWFGKAAPLER